MAQESIKYNIKEDYSPPFDNPLDLSQAVHAALRHFEDGLTEKLNLRYMPAPVVVSSGEGKNDDLMDPENRITFELSQYGTQLEVVQTLVKYKRHILGKYHSACSPSSMSGIWMNSISLKKHTALDNLHSTTVHKLDFELILASERRTLGCLKKYISDIYSSIVETEKYVCDYLCKSTGKSRVPRYPKEIEFVHTEELIKKYPYSSPLERENDVTETHGAVFIIGVGSYPEPAVNHVDSMTSTSYGQVECMDDEYCGVTHSFGDKYNKVGLNGHLMLWSDVLETSVEVCAVGIRCSKESLRRQMALASRNDDASVSFHRELFEGTVPPCIGGGIGKYRLALCLLGLAHLGEIHADYWPENQIEELRRHNVEIL